MNIGQAQHIETREDAIAFAQDWQYWQAEQDLTYTEMLEWQSAFSKLAIKFNITAEFEENGII